MKNSNTSKHLAFGGIFTALGVLLIYVSTILPVNKLILLGLASCIIPISILTTNTKNSLIVYGATSILSLIIVPNKGMVISYILLFGIYGFIKFFLEKLRNAPIEILLKLLYFNISILAIYSLYNSLFTDIITIKVHVLILLIILQIGFIVYDYVLTVFINYANKKLIKRLK